MRMSLFQDRIGLKGQTFPVKDLLLAITGRKWHEKEKTWSFPLTVTTFNLLRTLFPNAEIDSSLDAMRMNSESMRKAMEAKVDPDPPFIFWEKTKSWPHQRRAFWFAYYRMIAQGGAMLALDMGCGKSKVAIDLINAFNCNSVLILCPKSVMDVWPSEFALHSHHPYLIEVCRPKHSVEKRTAMARQFMDEHSPGQRKVVVVNHEAAWRRRKDVELFGDFALSRQWDMVIVDESHRAKTAGGKFSKFLRYLRECARYRLGLTGTPAPHSIIDVYAQARFIDPTVFTENIAVFRSDFVIMGGYGNYQVIGFKNTEKFNERFHSLAFQVKANDVLDLPDRVHMTRYAILGDEERAAYKAMKSQFVAEVKSGVITASNALVKLLRLAQITQGTVTSDLGADIEIGDSKRSLLREVLEDINEPVVVFCRFRCDLRSVHAAAYGRKTFELSGEVNELDAWKEACAAGEPAVIAVQIQSGGVGISMVQARYCIYMSKDFNLGAYEQSLARVHRPGQNHSVTYIHLVAKDTVDETINNALAKRKDVIEEILMEVMDE